MLHVKNPDSKNNQNKHKNTTWQGKTVGDVEGRKRSPCNGELKETFLSTSGVIGDIRDAEA